MLAPFSGAPVDPEVGVAARAAAKLLEILGHYVEEVAPEIDFGSVAAASFALMGLSVAGDCEDRTKALGTFTAFAGIANGTGQPAMSLPSGMPADGLPIGIMTIGRPGGTV